jgi:hypothetical protein
MVVDQAFEHALSNPPFVGVELADRLELHAQSFVRAALGLVEDQRIGADVERT